MYHLFGMQKYYENTHTEAKQRNLNLHCSSGNAMGEKNFIELSFNFVPISFPTGRARPDFLLCPWVYYLQMCLDNRCTVVHLESWPDYFDMPGTLNSHPPILYFFPLTFPDLSISLLAPVSTIFSFL